MTDEAGVLERDRMAKLGHRPLEILSRVSLLFRVDLYGSDGTV